MADSRHAILIEDASLELVPKELLHHPEVLDVTKKFGVKPESQILDRNFHAKAISSLKGNSEKRGRPDVVHFALLDVTSTPLFIENRIRVLIHTHQDATIELKTGTRPPRTLQRFCGVMAKILSGALGPEESRLFDFKKNQSFNQLTEDVGADRIICLTRKGKISRLDEVTRNEELLGKNTLWVIGGFPKGSFDPEVLRLCDETIAISELPLAAHVVTARLAYEIERNLAL